MAKRGRPKGTVKPDSMTKYLKVRVSPEEKKELIARINLSGLDISQYLRMLIELDKKEGYICKY